MKTYYDQNDEFEIYQTGVRWAHANALEGDLRRLEVFLEDECLGGFFAATSHGPLRQSGALAAAIMGRFDIDYQDAVDFWEDVFRGPIAEPVLEDADTLRGFCDGALGRGDAAPVLAPGTGLLGACAAA